MSPHELGLFSRSALLRPRPTEPRARVLAETVEERREPMQQKRQAASDETEGAAAQGDDDRPRYRRGKAAAKQERHGRTGQRQHDEREGEVSCESNEQHQ